MRVRWRKERSPGGSSLEQEEVEEMKIAVIAADNRQTRLIFPEHLREKLALHGEVVFNEGGYEPENVKRLMKDADIVVTSWGAPRMTKEYLDEAPNLQLILHAAGTVAPIVDEEIWRRGIRVICAGIAIAKGVAETTLGLMISASKDFYRLNEQVHAGGWQLRTDKTVVDLVDITIGIIGAGMTGKLLIDLLKMYEVDIVVYDPYVTEETCREMGVKKVGLEELMRTSDIVSLHASAIPETRHMINAETLRWMKKDAGFINTSRGMLVDEQALYEHMAAGNLRFACLDVTDREPPVFENPLRNLKNVIFMPHIAGVVNNGLARIGRHIIKELELWEEGRPAIHEITEDIMFRIGKA